MQEFISLIQDIVYSYPYLIIFLGMLFGGETILLPAIYFSIRQPFLNLWLVITVAFMATCISDAFWYGLGRLTPFEDIKKWKVFHSKQKTIDGLKSDFDRHSFLILFLSKFVYGTRTMAQILSGSHKMKLFSYLIVNSLGILSLTLGIVLVAMGVQAGFNAFENILTKVEISFAVFIAVIILLHLWIKKRISKQLLLSSPVTTKEKPSDLSSEN